MLHKLPPLLTILAITLPLLTNCKIIIQAPTDLATKIQSKHGDKGIPYSIANYGIVPYGKTISGKLAVPSVLQDCIYQDIPSMQAETIIMAERSDCTFTQKSLNIQKQGGKLAIIMDSSIEAPESIIMVDDGYGFKLSIPTILISHDDGQLILQYIDKGVILAVSFDISLKSAADVDLWLDITDHKNLVFMNQFQSYYNKISTSLQTRINYPITSCSSDCDPNHCFQFTENTLPFNYCRFPKPRDWTVINGGKILIEEQLFQFYLFKQNLKDWWEYIIEFDETCLSLVDYPTCRDETTKKLNIKTKHLYKQLEETMKNTDRSLLTQLRYWQQQRNTNGIIYYPSVVVNNIVYRGNLEPVDVFQLICESLTPRPEGCLGDSEPSQVSLTNWIIIAVVLSIAFIVFLLICFRRIARRQLTNNMHGQVNALVNQYITMFEQKKFEGEEQVVELPQAQNK